MIIEALLNLIKLLLNVCFGWINLPDFPEALTNAINTVIEIVFQGVTLLGFFVRIETIQIVIPVLLFLINFDKVYKLTMFILRKIPFLNMS